MSQDIFFLLLFILKCWIFETMTMIDFSETFPVNRIVNIEEEGHDHKVYRACKKVEDNRKQDICPKTVMSDCVSCHVLEHFTHKNITERSVFFF